MPDYTIGIQIWVIYLFDHISTLSAIPNCYLIIKIPLHVTFLLAINLHTYESGVLSTRRAALPLGCAISHLVSSSG